MKIESELKKMRKLREDRTNLTNLSSLFSYYVADIASAHSQEELDEINSELEPYYRLIKAWNFDSTTYGYLRSRIQKLKRLKELIEGKKEVLSSNGATRGKAIRQEEATETDGETLEQVVEGISCEDADGDQGRITERTEVIARTEVENPTLIDLINFYKHNGLVGEEKTAILQTLGAIHGLCFGIESLSGSGKTYTLDILLDLLPKEDVYTLPQASDKALMYDTDKVNKARVMIVTELQKSANNKTVIEILKDLGEGRTAKRKVTKADRSGIEEQSIEAGKSVIYTLALENWFKKDRELERRYFQLYTDISGDQTKRILQSIAQREFFVEDELSRLSEVDIRRLKEHVSECLHLPEFRYVNPFAESVVKDMPTNIKARSFVNHYFRLIQASARFHHKRRIKDDGSIFVALEDVYFINQLYNDQFFKSVLRIPIAGEDLLAIFNESDYTSAAGIHRKLKEEGSPLTFPVIGDMLEELVEAGYLEKDSYNSKETGYRKISEIKGAEQRTDWQHVWDSGFEVVREKYPDYVGEWVNSQTEEKDGKISVLDPLQCKEVEVAGYDGK